MHWQIHSQDEVLSGALAGSLKISAVTAQVLINRGLRGEEAARLFLQPSLQHLHDPFLLPDMGAAVERIIGAIKGDEHITVYGDYDTDGVTSTALLLKFFRMIDVRASYYIPNRIREGYGMHKESLALLKKRGTDLIITVDNGINALDEIDYAGSLGMDVIVTDHHEPSERLPSAAAVINPKRGDSIFPFREMAGVGVVFNLIMALRQRLRDVGHFREKDEPRLRELLDIVAVGTIADVVPLVDENRIFVKFGIEEIKKSSSKGLIALRIISGLEPHQISTLGIAFRLAPRINAAGRIGDPELALRLLITDDPEEAGDLAQRLSDLNSKRQAVEAGILKEAEGVIEGEEGYADSLGLVVAGEGWHAGVIGIVATRLAEKHRKPSVVVGIDGGKGVGSARGVGNYNVIEALASCKDILINYGGHRHAAGITIDPKRIGEFKERFNDYVSRTLSEEERVETMFVDCEISPEDISEELIKELELLEPFGEKNPEPVFCLREMEVSDARVVAEKHLKLKFAGDMMMLDAIGFDMGHHGVMAQDVLDVAFIPQRDTWRGEGAIQLKLRDIKQT